MTDININPASFKDPAGFVFEYEGIIYRKVSIDYATHFNMLMQSGLYDFLVKKNWLLSHQESALRLPGLEDAYRILEPLQISTISYPYEWSFDMFKDAALLTLNIHKTAISYGMILKDASPFNIQFYKGKPILIDSLSFEKYDAAKPWIAYRQFCELFLFPLYLEYYLKAGIQKILSNYLDGIPAKLTAKLLPLRSRLNPGALLHVHLQNSIQEKKSIKPPSQNFSAQKMNRLVEHLRDIVAGLNADNSSGSEWSNYYEKTILSSDYLASKEKIFQSYIEDLFFENVLDIGANDGYFSRLLASKARQVTAVDMDDQCINRLYKNLKREAYSNLLPLIIDISNPSPAIGFNNKERLAFIDRVKPDLVVALALIHHLVIGRNIPLEMLAACLNSMAPLLIIEFVPKEDIKVKQLMGERAEAYNGYTQLNFENEFLAYFHLVKQTVIPGSFRTLYLLKRK